MIKSIQIENIKGIDNKKFELNIFPNKPSLLVAPNGFGKSSFAIAFNSMNNSRIILDNDNFHLERDTNLPRISIEYEKEDKTILNLEATNSTNKISRDIDYFVINNQIKPKGIGSQYGTATARLEIKDIKVRKIPDNVNFDYSNTNAKNKFGRNGKVLPNLNTIFSNLKLIEKLSENYAVLKKANGKIIQARINAIISNINTKNGTNDVLLEWINNNELNTLKQIEYLSFLGNLLNEFDTPLTETQNFLCAIQLIWLYNDDENKFKKACLYSNYRLDKQKFDDTLKTFNCTWKNIKSSEHDGDLIVKFPKATLISNGQRDILTFISMLFNAKSHLNKTDNILIIDEVFDYLDDANLIAAQYYITRFIDDFDKQGKRIYPLILTHLNPNYFKNFAFKDQKVYYLDKSQMQVNNNLIKLLRKRTDPIIKEDVDKYLFHYNPQTINRRNVFRSLSLPEKWGEANNFVEFLNIEVNKYINNQTYDPFAVCGAVRIKIEEIAYDKLQSTESKEEFIKTHTTRNKLEKAEEYGVVSPESHYLLGIIYNEGMHWKENQDNVSPIASKLENLVIKKLIKDVFI